MNAAINTPSSIIDEIDIAIPGPQGPVRRRISLAQITAVLRNGQRDPAPLSLFALVRKQQKEILAARKRGQTLDQVAAALSTVGIPIKSATLRTYLHLLNKNTSNKRIPSHIQKEGAPHDQG